MRYTGWIPTITGCLLFDHCEYLKDIAIKRKGNSINHVDEDRCRYIILSALINWRDNKERNECKEKFRVIVQGLSRPNSQTFVGNIYIYVADLEVNGNKFFNAQNDISILNMNILNKEDYLKISEKVRTGYDKIQETLTGITHQQFYKCSFILDKYGFVELFAKGEEGESSKIIFRQAFYFLKASLHKHQHHPARDDSLTTVHKSNDPDLGIKMINDIKKSLVDIKRNFKIDDCHRLTGAEGIANYGKSLILSCFVTNKIDQKQYDEQICYMDFVIGSLRCIADNIKFKTAKKAHQHRVFRSIVLVIFAVMAPFVLIYQLAIKTILDPWLIPMFTYKIFGISLGERLPSMVFFLLLVWLFLYIFRWFEVQKLLITKMLKNRDI